MAGVEGRVALVTGASQGIGRACALVLAESGAKLALCARNQEKLEQLAGEINSKGGEAAAFKLDVANEEEIKTVVKAVIARFGKIDILVNNAGLEETSSGDLSAGDSHRDDGPLGSHGAGDRSDSERAHIACVLEESFSGARRLFRQQSRDGPPLHKRQAPTMRLVPPPDARPTS